MKNKTKYNGFSIVEVLIALTMLSIIMGGVIMSQVNSYNATRIARDRIFAGQKAMQMMEELRSFSLSGNEDSNNNLDKKDDGSFFPAILTTEKLNGATVSPVTDSNVNSNLPSSPTSSNYLYSTSGITHWRFVRHVKIESLNDEQKSRKVTVQVFLSDKDMKPLYPPLAELSSLLRTKGVYNEPSQVIDTYALTLSNVPGWWSALAELKDRYEGVVSDLRNRNVGLDFKSHYINRLSYGRDTFYAPYINMDAFSKDDTQANQTYYYPGKIYNTKKNTTEYYYPYNSLRGDFSRLLTFDPSISTTNKVIVNPLSDSRSNTLADQYNNAVRYPEEVAIHTRLRQQNDLITKTPLEPTYRLFLEGLSSSNKYRNSMIANLHGELFPFPPLRNFSDAAKDPANLPTVRVVTHPEQINYPNNSQIRLRVYAYKKLDGASPAIGDHINNISIFIPTNGLTGANAFSESKYLNDITGLNMPEFSMTGPTNAITVANIMSYLGIEYIGSSTQNPYTRYTTAGGTPTLSIGTNNAVPASFNSGTTWNNAFQIIQNPQFDYDGNGSTLDASGNPQPVNGLLIILKAPTQLSCPSVSSRGLPANKKLYGMDYIPTPLGGTVTAPTFPNVKDLDSTATTAKNTARWIININTANVAGNPFANFNDRMMTVETRLPTSPTNTTLTGFGSPTLTPVITGSVDLTTGKRMDATVNRSVGTIINTNSVPQRSTVESLNQVPNVSRTYVWENNSAQGTPSTERFQMIGDPRYNPYLDTLRSRFYNTTYSLPTTSVSTTVPVSSVLSSDYPTLTQLIGPTYNAAPNDNYVDDDVPRMFQIFRQSLIRSNAVYTSMTGYSNYYHGIGGEIGLDTTNGQAFDVPKNHVGMTGVAPISHTDIDEITAGIKYVRGKTQTWTSLPWLGELYPDNTFNLFWRDTGNLPTADATTGGFMRDDIEKTTFKGLSPDGILNTPLKIAANQRLKRMQEKGCASFFDGSSNPTSDSVFFNHVSQGAGSTATLSTVMGSNLSKSLNFPAPNTIVSLRPFKLEVSGSGKTPPERADVNFGPLYKNVRTELSYLPYISKPAPYQNVTESSAFYKQDSDSTVAASGIIRMHEYDRSTTDTSNNNRSYVVANGLAPAGTEAATFMAKYAVSTMIYAFLNTGNFNNISTDVNSTTEIPYISIRQNNTKTSDPTPISVPGLTPKEGSVVSASDINFEWYTRWRKWDETKYTQSYSDNWIDNTSNVSVRYQILYSDDNELTWKYVSVTGSHPAQTASFTGADAIVGTYNESYSIPNQPFNTTTGISQNDGLILPVSSLTNNKRYIIRLECYRLKDGNVLEKHYSYHQRLFNIKR